MRERRLASTPIVDKSRELYYANQELTELNAASLEYKVKNVQGMKNLRKDLTGAMSSCG